MKAAVIHQFGDTDVLKYEDIATPKPPPGHILVKVLGGDVLAKSIQAARVTGVIVAFGFAAGPEVTFDIRSLFFEQKQLKGSMASDKSDMEFGLQLVKEGKIKPLLDHTLPLSSAAEAHRQIANNEVKGNIVLLPWAA